MTPRRGAAAVAPALLALLTSGLLAAPAPAQVRDAPSPPSLKARTAILVETSTGDVLFARRAGERRQIASTTKLMTALIALEERKLTDRITSTGYKGLAVESKIGLVRGERLTVADLITGLLLASGNDAAKTIAEGISGSVPAFVRKMNRRAARLGLTDTRFDNPIGLDGAENYSSAADLVKMTLALRRNPFFVSTVARTGATLASGRRTRNIKNRNRLVGRYPEVTGVKTGHTLGAGYVLVGAGTRGGISVISAVLGDPSEAARDADTLALLRYGLRSYQRATLVTANRPLARVDAKGSDASIALVAERSYRRVVRTTQRPRVALRVPAEIEGPLPAGARVGTAVVRQGQRVLALIPLVTATEVPASSTTKELVDRLGGAGTLALAALVAALIAVLLINRRRRHRRDSRQGTRTA